MNSVVDEPVYFLDFVDQLVLSAIASNRTSFNEIVLSLPGVYPSVVLSSLQRLVSIGKVPFPILANAVRWTRTRQKLQTSQRRHIALPIPHPLDYDWRFSNAATMRLLNEGLTVTHPGDSIALLGAPSVLRMAIECGYPRQLLLLDANPLIVRCLGKEASKAQVVCCDLLRDPLLEFSAAAVMVDPPWYDDYIQAFFWVGCYLCTVGGYLLVSIPPLGTRPNMERERTQMLNWTQRMGLSLVRIEPAALSYRLPPFERNALKAEGLSVVPAEWRRGDLAVFMRTHEVHTPRPMVPTQEGEWVEEELHGIRIRLRCTERSRFEDPSLISMVPGDVLPSVSRRDQRRRLVDVWTSGNRVFACRGLSILQTIVRALADEQPPHEAVAVELRRRLTVEEAGLVSRAARQVEQVVSLERGEQVFWEEELDDAKLALASSE